MDLISKIITERMLKSATRRECKEYNLNIEDYLNDDANESVLLMMESELNKIIVRLKEETPSNFVSSRSSKKCLGEYEKVLSRVYLMLQ